jgi:hypothetical protein
MGGGVRRVAFFFAALRKRPHASEKEEGILIVVQGQE